MTADSYLKYLALIKTRGTGRLSWARHDLEGQARGMTAPHPSLGYQRVKPGPRTSRLPGAEIGRLVPPSQPQFTSPHPPRPELGAAKRRRAASRAPPLPASKPGAGAGSRRRQFAKRSLELGSTPTQERETVATAGVGRRRGRGGGGEGGSSSRLGEFAGQR